ncbi:MAG: single-stranded-DNA-specific exonuclease RecJ [Deltaproteobacteria bacterium]|nr:single-stranded-DNA-specific exonuclease RecJ [Deltaproteobacteria bacterium]
MLVDRLIDELAVVRPIAACLVNRGYKDAAAARQFLDPRLAELSLPSGMADMDKAAGRVVSAIGDKEKVGVFSDYDVDGVSSAALTASFLGDLGVETETIIADRFAGYGLGADAVDRFAAAGCSLVLVFDCGTSDHAAIRHARERKMDVVVVDHHRIEGAVPDVLAFVNPQRVDCGFGDTTLASVGLAFYFAAAIRTRLAQNGLISRKDVDPRSLLDLVALGTVADVMPLAGNNRILVHHGLRQISSASRPGIRSLIRAARIRAIRVRANHIAFQLAPRLNAAGRLGSAMEAFHLLMAKTPADADRLADRLDRLSQDRRAVEDEVVSMARRKIEEADAGGEPIVFVAEDGWHRGVLGIVAARIAEESRKPTYVVGFEGDVGTGSARAQGQIDLHESLSHAASSLLRFGGHRDAAGFTVEKGRVGEFKRLLVEFARENLRLVEGKGVVCDARLQPVEITRELLADLERLGPFGQGNPEPVFDVDGLYVLDKRVVGREHLKLELKTPVASVAAFGPRMGAGIDSIPALIRVAAVVSPDEWRKEGSPELRLVASPVQGT